MLLRRGHHLDVSVKSCGLGKSFDISMMKIRLKSKKSLFCKSNKSRKLKIKKKLCAFKSSAKAVEELIYVSVNSKKFTTELSSSFYQKLVIPVTQPQYSTTSLSIKHRRPLMPTSWDIFSQPNWRKQRSRKVLHGIHYWKLLGKVQWTKRKCKLSNDNRKYKEEQSQWYCWQWKFQ